LPTARFLTTTVTSGGGDDGAFVSKFSFGPAIAFSEFGGHLLIDPDTGVFYLSGGFALGPGGSINPHTQQVTFSVGSYAMTVPGCSFIKYTRSYLYQKTVNNIFLCIYIKSTSTPGSYILLANSKGAPLSGITSPVAVALTIGDDFGTTQMKAKFH
jgi:hypothetical protein